MRFLSAYEKNYYRNKIDFFKHGKGRELPFAKHCVLLQKKMVAQTLLTDYYKIVKPVQPSTRHISNVYSLQQLSVESLCFKTEIFPKHTIVRSLLNKCKECLEFYFQGTPKSTNRLCYKCATCSRCNSPYSKYIEAPMMYIDSYVYTHKPTSDSSYRYYKHCYNYIDESCNKPRPSFEDLMVADVPETSQETCYFINFTDKVRYKQCNTCIMSDLKQTYKHKKLTELEYIAKNMSLCLYCEKHTFCFNVKVHCNTDKKNPKVMTAYSIRICHICLDIFLNIFNEQCAMDNETAKILSPDRHYLEYNNKTYYSHFSCYICDLYIRNNSTIFPINLNDASDEDSLIFQGHSEVVIKNYYDSLQHPDFLFACSECIDNWKSTLQCNHETEEDHRSCLCFDSMYYLFINELL
nr:Caab136 [Calliteara abietis nucleopolyhedrovirus]